MDTTLNPKQTDPRHVLVARAEEEFAHVYVAAIVWQSSQADYREVGAATRPDFIAAARKPGAFRAAEPTYRSGGRGEDSTPTTSTSGSERTGRRRADRRRPVARVDAVAPVDGARSRNPGARNRTAQGQPGTNGPRYCQGFRAEPSAQDISASATADCHPDGQAGADAPVAASRSAAAGRRTAVVIGAAAADARALTPFFQGERTRSGCACQDTSFEIRLQASGR